MNTGGPNLKKLKKKKPFIAIKKIENFFIVYYIIPAGFGWGIGRVQKKRKWSD